MITGAVIDSKRVIETIDGIVITGAVIDSKRVTETINTSTIYKVI